MRVAIIDLGTNTFNLIIADLDSGGKPVLVFKTREPVKLGDKINEGTISPEAYQRGLKAVTDFKSIITSYDVQRAEAFGTSAIRSAGNGNDFCKDIERLTGISIQVIDGDKEAEYIYMGVREAVKLSEEPVLILDIGGGSNELIIASKTKIFWKQSFNLGIARLLQKFSPSDPITDEELNRVTEFIKKELAPLFEAVNKYPVNELIGASGSFETFAELASIKAKRKFDLNDTTEFNFADGEFQTIHNDLLYSTRADRAQMKGMLEMRADMIVLASIFVDVVVKACNIRKIRVSDYALKEGAMYSILKN
jgi:exopolyphosphatase / guanosine-5'-triphosphate,3'-diphosphate pyrophosphatase